MKFKKNGLWEWLRESIFTKKESNGSVFTDITATSVRDDGPHRVERIDSDSTATDSTKSAKSG